LTAPALTVVTGSVTGAGLARQLPALGLAALAAAAVALAIGPWPVGVFQDDGVYVVLAKSLANGEGYRYLNLPGAPNATHYPPLYPAMLALLWKVWPLFPSNVVLFKFANAVLLGVAAAGTWRLARGRFGLGPVAAALATAAFTACAPVVLLSVMVLSEPLFLALLLPVLLLGERAAESGRDRDALAAGAAGAALALVRTLGVVVIPATALVLIWRRRWRAAAITVAAGAVVLLPWQLWVAAHAGEVPDVFLGKYGAYTAWLSDAVRAEGPRWLMKLVWFNTAQIIAQGWATVAVDPLHPIVRWSATVALATLFAAGWARMLRRAPVVAWSMAAYLALVVAWPFMPARFTWGIWPLVGCAFALGVDAVWRWRPPRRYAPARLAALTVAFLLAVGYARYNALGVTRGWWTRVQQGVADRARPLAEWVVANTAPDAVLATDDDVLLHLYTGRRAMPNGAFTAQEHMRPQTPAFATATLRRILRTHRVDFVLVSTEYGTYAARGLVGGVPQELRLVRALSSGAVFAPVRVAP
jgi:hypothetical protein